MLDEMTLQNASKFDIFCPYKLGNKCSKETILNMWRNEKYFSDLLIYQQLQFGQNSIEIIIENNFAFDFALIVTKQLINKQNWKIFFISPNI